MIDGVGKGDPQVTGYSDYASLGKYTISGSIPIGAPVLDPISDISVNEGDTVTLIPTANDPDGDALTYTYTGWMTSDTYTTGYQDAGIHTVTVTVSDGTLTDSQDVTVTVANV